MTLLLYIMMGRKDEDLKVLSFYQYQKQLEHDGSMHRLYRLKSPLKLAVKITHETKLRSPMVAMITLCVQ